LKHKWGNIRIFIEGKMFVHFNKPDYKIINPEN